MLNKQSTFIAFAIPMVLFFVMSLLVSCTDQFGDISLMNNDDPSLTDPDDPDNDPECDDGTGIPTPTLNPAKFYFINKGTGLGGQPLWYSAGRVALGGNIGWEANRRLSNIAKTSRGVAATIHNNEIFTFYKGGSSESVFYMYSSNGRDWYGDRSIGAARTKKAPAAVSYGGNLYVYTIGESDEKIWVSKSSDGRTWSSHKAIKSNNFQFDCCNSDGAKDDLGVTVFNGEIVVTYRAKNKKIFYLRSTDGENFGRRLEIPGVITKGGIGIATFRGNCYIAYEGETGNRLWVTKTNNFSSFTHSVLTVNQNQAKTDEAPALATDGSRLIAAYKQNSGNNIYYAYTRDGDNWAGNVSATGQTTKGGVGLVYFRPN